MKKKVIIAIALAAILVTGTAFAADVHPNGLGIGALWGGNAVWGGNGTIGNSVALSLKVPSVPIFWGISFHLGGALSLGVQGDSYILGSQLIPTLSWFLGIGGYVNLVLGNEAYIGLGARLPIGLTWQPIDILEIFLNVAPSLGLGFWTAGNGGIHFPDGGIGWELGIRLWFK